MSLWLRPASLYHVLLVFSQTIQTILIYLMVKTKSPSVLYWLLTNTNRLLFTSVILYVCYDDTTMTVTTDTTTDFMYETMLANTNNTQQEKQLIKKDILSYSRDLQVSCMK